MAKQLSMDERLPARPPGAAPAGSGGVVAEGKSLWADAGVRLLHNPAAVASAVFLLLVLALAVLAPWIAPYPYDFQDYSAVRSYPTAQHWFGTDDLGRDIFSRMLYGARVSMTVGFLVTAIEIVVGGGLGILAGYYGGRVDMIIMRLTDIMFAFPDILLAILILGIFGPNFFNVLLALSLTGWPTMARIARGQVLALKEQEFVQAAHALGGSDGRIMLRHILPNILSPLIVTATIGVGGVILSEATLSYLGIGIRPPQPSWGVLINQLTPYVSTLPLLVVFPSVVLALTVLAFNFLGDALRDALDPRLKE